MVLLPHPDTPISTTSRGEAIGMTARPLYSLYACSHHVDCLLATNLDWERLGDMRRHMLALIYGLACLVGAPSIAALADIHGAGFVDLSLTDPVEGGPMPAFVFFPGKSPGGPTGLGPYTVDAARGAEPAPGSYPLIVFSHGTGGSRLNHHDSLTTLARAGFVTAAVEHPRDNFRDDSGFGTDLQLIGRAHHIVRLIDGVLADALAGPLVDRTRIGMAGHSIGGYTALLIAGAVPNFDLGAAYRQAQPNDICHGSLMTS
jgi:predicted dienelactone hydrolase